MKYTRHIDNGGIFAEVVRDEESYVSLSLTTSYHGHPNVVASLNGLTKEDLRGIGMLLLNFASESE